MRYALMHHAVMRIALMPIALMHHAMMRLAHNTTGSASSRMPKRP